MKVFVTGAGGFIGSHLTERLLEKGYKVKALYHYNSTNDKAWLAHTNAEGHKNAELIAGDIRDGYFMRRAMEDCQAVLHLAALIGIPYSYTNPQAYVETNIHGTLNVLEAARDFKYRRVIHTSTSEVYGTARTVPIDENHPLQGQSPYSASKIAADQIAYSYACSFDLPVITVRPFNTFGPRQSLRAVIPTVITQLVDGQGDVRIGSTTPTRDFSFVEDTVSGFIAALETPNQKAFGETINLGSRFEISIGEMINMAAKLLGKKANIITEQNRLRPENSEVERLFSENAKAREYLGWTPEYAGVEGFERALVKTIAWYSDSANRALFESGSRYII